VTVSVPDLRAVTAPLLEPEGWLVDALARIDQDPLAGRLAADRRVRLARSARAAGAAMAQPLRACEGPSAQQALQARGVTLDEDVADATAGPFVYTALYSAPPPRVTLFRRTVTAVQALLDATGLGRRLAGVTVTDVVLAHELCHHLVYTGEAPAAVRPQVEILRIGRWKRRTVVRAAEEIAAAGFAAAWCGVSWAPDLVDRLLLVICRERLDLSSGPRADRWGRRRGEPRASTEGM